MSLTFSRGVWRSARTRSSSEARKSSSSSRSIFLALSPSLYSWIDQACASVVFSSPSLRSCRYSHDHLTLLYPSFHPPLCLLIFSSLSPLLFEPSCLRLEPIKPASRRCRTSAGQSATDRCSELACTRQIGAPSVYQLPIRDAPIERRSRRD